MSTEGGVGVIVPMCLLPSTSSCSSAFPRYRALHPHWAHGRGSWSWAGRIRVHLGSPGGPKLPRCGFGSHAIFAHCLLCSSCKPFHTSTAQLSTLPLWLRLSGFVESLHNATTASWRPADDCNRRSIFLPSPDVLLCSCVPATTPWTNDFCIARLSLPNRVICPAAHTHTSRPLVVRRQEPPELTWMTLAMVVCSTLESAF